MHCAKPALLGKNVYAVKTRIHQSPRASSVAREHRGPESQVSFAHALAGVVPATAPGTGEQGRHLCEDRDSSMYFRVATRAERDHERQYRFTRYSMMNGDRAFIASRRIADPATVAVSLQNRFAETTEILLILTLEGVTRRTEAERENLRIPAAAIHRPLYALLHSYTIP